MRAGALAALLAAVALAGCGSGGEQSTTASQATVAKAAVTEAGRQGDEDKRPPPKPPAPEQSPPVAHKRSPGSKAVAPGVPVIKGGDNSIQAFGIEGEESEAARAAATLAAYLGASAAGDWAGACAQASKQLEGELAQLIKRAKLEDGAEKPKGCPATLALLFGDSPASAPGEAAEVGEVLSFRVRADGYAYLIYEDGEGATRFIAMAKDGEAWKVNVLQPEEFLQPGRESSQ